MTPKDVYEGIPKDKSKDWYKIVLRKLSYTHTVPICHSTHTSPSGVLNKRKMGKYPLYTGVYIIYPKMMVRISILAVK